MDMKVENAYQAIDDSRLIEYTVSIVLSYLAKNNGMMIDDVVALIYDVYNAVAQVDAKPRVISRALPAVPVEESVYYDYIVCLEDGKKMKMLKKHLKTAYNMTPDEYRQKWGLPSDYPMVAPEYANRRSDLARAIGLGKGKFKLDDDENQSC